MKKKLLGLTCFAVALCATVGGTVALNASADVDGSSWYLREDGYYYEYKTAEDAPLADLWDWSTPYNDSMNYYMYKIGGVSGSIDNDTFKATSKERLTGTSVTISPTEAIMAHLDYPMPWFGIGPDNRSNRGRDYDFTFGVDFTNLNSGNFAFLSGVIKVTFNLANNQIIVENKKVVFDGVKWGSGNRDTATFHSFDFSSLTGVQTVSVLVEEACDSNFDLDGYNDKDGDGIKNVGGNVVVWVGDTKVCTRRVETFGWYAQDGYGLLNNTGKTMSVHSTTHLPKPEYNEEGWKLGEDGYYYEENAPVYDLFDWEYDPEGDKPLVHWYKLNQTGSVFSNNLSTSSREALTGGSVTLSTSQALYPQYDSWGKDYFFQGNTNQSSDVYRHMDFTFMVDFTNLNGGYFVYFSHATKIAFQLSSNQIIVEEKEAANGTDYTSWSNMQTTFLDFPTSMKGLTGWQQVTVKIEDRVEASKSEITRDNNKGAKVTVTIGESSVSTVINKMGYYYGIYGIENLTGTNLSLKSVKPASELALNEVLKKSYMTAGASIRLSKAGNGIRFETNVPKASVANLAQYVGEDKAYDSVAFGTVIVPVDYLTEGETLETLRVAGKVAMLEARGFYEAVSTEDTYKFWGSLVDIRDYNYYRAFIGVGYIKTVVDGVETYNYLAYDLNNARSLYSVAVAAYNYEGTSAEDKQLIKEQYIDTVVVLNENGEYAGGIEGYEAPYSIDMETGVITSTSVIKTVVAINGDGSALICPTKYLEFSADHKSVKIGG